MEPKDLTIKILEEIRDSVRETNARLDQTNARLEDTRADMHAGFEHLTDRIVETQIRTATAISALGGTMEEVKSLLRDRLDLRDRVERCELDILRLKERTGVE